MNVFSRFKYIAVALLLSLLTAAALLLVSNTAAKAADDPMSGVSGFYLNCREADGSYKRTLSMSMTFSPTSDRPDYCTYSSTIPGFSAKLGAGESMESFDTITLQKNYGSDILLYEFQITYLNDTLSVVVYIQAYPECIGYRAYTDWLNTGDSEMFKRLLDGEASDLGDLLAAPGGMSFYLQLNAPRSSTVVSFSYLNDDYKYTLYSQTYEIGETPEFTRKHPDRVFFTGWDKEIATITNTDPVTYTAQYEFPSVLVRNDSGEVVRQYLEYDYIDETLLFKDFTEEIKDSGSDHPSVGDLLEFENRKDFWYCQTADTTVAHTLDTNLTLEAVSFRLMDKTTHATYEFRNAQELHGKHEVLVNYYWYSMGQGDSHTFIGMLISSWNKLFGKDQKNEEQLKHDFVTRYYPECAIADPDNYELVYMYYYSVDLHHDIEGGQTDDAYFNFRDDYKTSTLHVSNNLTSDVYVAPFSYDTSKGCYFLLDMSRVWSSMGFVTKENADSLGGVKAKIVNAKYRIKDWTGTVVFDDAAAADSAKALTTFLYFYTGDLDPDYAEVYNVTIEFYDVVVFQEDKTDNIGSLVDDSMPFWKKLWESIKNVWTGTKESVSWFAKFLGWLGEHWYVVLIVIGVVILISFVIKLIVAFAPKKSYLVSPKQSKPRRRKKK